MKLKIWGNLLAAFEKSPAKMSGYVSAITIYFNKNVDWFPSALFVPSVMIVIFIAEAAQKKEDQKTTEAMYYTVDPTMPDYREIEILITHNHGIIKKHKE